jgi:hypothetical protein
VQPTPDTRYIAWVDPGGGALKLVVALNAFLGKTCQIHVAMKDGFSYTPKAMLEAVFDYTFNQIGLELLVGIVNSKNAPAMKYDKHLGFEESHRLPGVHDDGGDIVIMTMNREQCRYLKSTVKEAA